MLVAADNTPDAGFGFLMVSREEMWLYALIFLCLDLIPSDWNTRQKMLCMSWVIIFGLCHPNASDSSCPTGAIPQDERNGAASCMVVQLMTVVYLMGSFRM